MMEWKSSFKIFASVLLLLLTGCATGGKLKDANEYYRQKKYLQAILLYDQYIERHSHSAEETIAELKRSECYLNLGIQTYTRNNLNLAERLLFLANSNQADKFLDDVHWELAEEAVKKQDTDLQLKHLDYIAEFIAGSEHMPEVLLQRIKIYLKRNQRVAAYRDYKKIWDKYSESPQADSARVIIDPVIPWFLQNSERNKDEGNFALAIAEFLVYSAYPSRYQKEIISKVGETYYLWAESETEKDNYAEAMEYFAKAMEFSPSLENRIQTLLNEICDNLINNGDILKQKGKLPEAIKIYQRCYILKPGFKAAKDKIEHTKVLQVKFARADSLYKLALSKESRKKYAAARDLYKKVYELNGLPDVNKDVMRMKNYLRAENSPQDFALEIIRDYGKGIIPENVNLRYLKLVTDYGDQVSTTDWKALYSFGEFKYEVRIDILSPHENIYLAWRVHLIERSVVPLNKDSEEMMKKK